MQLVLGFDFGLTYIGVAIGQSITASASGVATLKCPRPKDSQSQPRGEPRWREVRALIEEHNPGQLVVGLPLNMDDSESAMAAEARTFAQQLHKRYDLPVALHDERLTSRAAEEMLADAIAMGRAHTTHELAACLILESWFNANQTKT